MTSVATDRAANISARCKVWASSGNAKSRPYMWWSSQSSGALQIRPLARRRRSLKVSISNRRVRYEGDNGGLNPHFAIKFNVLLPTADTDGDWEEMPWLAGQGVGLIHEIRPAKDVVETMMGDAKAILKRLSGSL